MNELKGFCHPLSPEGKTQLVGRLPWHFSCELMVIDFKADPDAVRRHIPYPLEPMSEPDFCQVWFPSWLSLWDDGKDMIFTNPERTKYKELIIFVGCNYKGTDGRKVAYIWVDNDFTLFRGWFAGAPKRLGRTHMSFEKHNLYSLNSALKPFGTGTKLKAFTEAHGDRIATGTMTLGRKISADEIPAKFKTKQYAIIHWPTVEIGRNKPEVMKLVEGVSEVRYGDCWEAKDATLTFNPSELEEHISLKPKEITGAYFVTMGSTRKGFKLLYDYLNPDAETK